MPLLDPIRTSNLLHALNNNETIFKIHYDNPDCKETLSLDKKYGFTSWGWGTAFGNINDRLLELIFNPHEWQVEQNQQLNDNQNTLETANENIKTLCHSCRKWKATCHTPSEAKVKSCGLYDNL